MTVDEAKRIIIDFREISSPSEDEEFVYTEALDFLIKEEDDPDAMMALGGFYYEKKEFDLARKYYEMAAVYDIDYADCCLGYIWYYGRTGQKDYEKAFRHYSRSMKRGNINSAYKVADMYKNGYAVEKDYDKYVSIIEDLYPKVKKEKNLFRPVPEIFTRLAHIRLEQDRTDEAIMLFMQAKDFLAQRIYHSAFFGNLSIMKWLVDDLYELIDFEVDDMDLYDLFYVLNRPSLTTFKYDGKKHTVQSTLEDGAYVVRFDDKWYKSREDFFAKASIDGQRLTSLLYELEDFRVIMQ